MSSDKEVKVLFRTYETWYQSIYLKELMDDDDDMVEAMEELEDAGWVNPLKGLVPLTAADIRAAEEELGAFPAAWQELLLQVGVGQLLCAMEGEPVEQEILHPQRAKAERTNMLSWLSAKGVTQIREELDMDITRCIPIMKPDHTCWVVLAGQGDGDDRTFVFDHDFEGGYEGAPLCGPQPLTAFLDDYLQRAMHKDPLNGFNCWEPAPK